jgi:hypothetical protein
VRGGNSAQSVQAKEEEGGRQGQVGRLAAGSIGPEAEKNPSRIEIGFLNLPRLWKFA